MTKQTPPPSCLPLIEPGTGKRLKRKFLGNLFPKDTSESNELKAYTKGFTHYFFKNEGVIVGGTPTNPIRMKIVRQKYYY